MAAQLMNLDLVPGGITPVVKASQYDTSRYIYIRLYNGGEVVDLTDYTTTIEGTREDGTAFTTAFVADDEAGGIGHFRATATMTNEAGSQVCELVLVGANGYRNGSANFILEVEPAAMDEQHRPL